MTNKFLKGKLPFVDIAREQYLSQIAQFTPIQKQRIWAGMQIILTLFALSFFGIFAINPTLTTIVNLKRQLADANLAVSNLQVKIQNIELLQQKYTALSPDLNVILSAIPTSPSAPTLFGKIQSFAKNNQVTIQALEVKHVGLISRNGDRMVSSSFPFSLTASGSYTNLEQFLTGLTSIDRIITINSISLGRDTLNPNVLQLTVNAKAYYQE